MDCASATTLGPSNGWAYVEGVIELPPDIDGRVVSLTGDTKAYGGAVYLARCGPCSEGGTLLAKDDAVVTGAELPAGRYLVRLYAPANAGPVTVGVSIQ